MDRSTKDDFSDARKLVFDRFISRLEPDKLGLADFVGCIVGPHSSVVFERSVLAELPARCQPILLPGVNDWGELWVRPFLSSSRALLPTDQRESEVRTLLEHIYMYA